MQSGIAEDCRIKFDQLQKSVHLPVVFVGLTIAAEKSTFLLKGRFLVSLTARQLSIQHHESCAKGHTTTSHPNPSQEGVNFEKPHKN